VKNIKRTTRTTQKAMTRWLHAGPRDKAGAYRAWQVAESDRRRAIISGTPHNGRHAVIEVAA